MPWVLPAVMQILPSAGQLRIDLELAFGILCCAVGFTHGYANTARYGADKGLG
ncbi:MAG: hypothetical protein FWD49_01175 [Firmicutes bacterium]|nr:hypothetical protein [Bacillota bacterium]